MWKVVEGENGTKLIVNTITVKVEGKLYPSSYIRVGETNIRHI
jgi:hypothetical protein